MNEQTGKPVFEGEILLCEDNHMNQELICSRLAKLGLKTTTAENGKEGIEKAEYRIQNGIKPFDLVFMDIYMPVMDGLEAAAEIGKLNTGTPIIAMTAGSSPAEREQYAAHGMPDCLNKPFTSQELLDCLTKYIRPKDRPKEPNSAYQSAMQNEEKLKIKLMHTFIKENKNIHNEITRAIDDGDIKLAHRLAHTLKSGAGFFGKTGLQKAAGDAESLLKNEENRITAAALNNLKIELDAVLEEFAPLAAETYESAACGPALHDEEKIQTLFEELETMLDGGDVQCLNLTGQLRLIPEVNGPLVNGPLVNEPLVRELIQQIEYFEFGRAKETLARLKEIWKRPAYEKNI